MKKVLLTALISTVAIGSTLANAPCATFNGFYLGGGINYGQEKFSGGLDLVGPNAQTIVKALGGTSTSQSISTKFNGAGVKLFVGYGAIISQGFYLGAEVGLGYDRLVGSKKKEGLDANKKVNYSIAARAGVAIDNILPFLKVGYEGRPSLKLSTEGLDLSIKRNGIILGGGVDVAVNKNVFVRLEYVHGFGAKSNKTVDIRSAVTQRFGVDPGALSLSGRVKTTTDTFMLGAGYKF